MYLLVLQHSSCIRSVCLASRESVYLCRVAALPLA